MGNQEYARDNAVIVYDEAGEFGTRTVSTWVDANGSVSVCEHITGPDVQAAFAADEFEHRVIVDAKDVEDFECALGRLRGTQSLGPVVYVEDFFEDGPLLADLMDVLDSRGAPYGYLSLDKLQAHFRPAQRRGD